MTQARHVALAGVVLFCGLGMTGRAQAPAPAAKEPLEAVQIFFRAMEAQDAVLASTVLVPEGSFSSIREVEGKPVLRHTTKQEFLAQWGKNSDKYLERIWSPEISRHGRLAIVTAPYDFHLNGTFSHCGVDVFEVFDTGHGWMISGGAYTVQKEGCAPSPLGPLPTDQRR
jgi:hypothetical protein